MRRSPCSWPARGRIGDRGVERRRKESPDEARRDPYPPCGWENRAECVSLGRVLRFSSDLREGRGFPPCCANLKANLAKRESNCVPLLRLRPNRKHFQRGPFSSDPRRLARTHARRTTLPLPSRASSGYGVEYGREYVHVEKRKCEYDITELSFTESPRRHEN
jgi:hypothetical protein